VKLTTDPQGILKTIAAAQSLIMACHWFLDEWLYEYKKLPRPVDTGMLYHYTSIQTCCAILESDDLFLFDSRHCNDTQEYTHGRETVRAAFAEPPARPVFRRSDFPERSDFWLRYEYRKKNIDTVLDGLRRQYYLLNPDWHSYVFCLSGPRFPPAESEGDLYPQDNLSMWRGYSADGGGACILILEHQLRGIARAKGLMTVPVLYEEGRKDFLCRMLFRLIYDIYLFGRDASQAHTTDNLHHFGIRLPIQDEDLMQIGAMAYWILPTFFKHPGFVDENETRLVYCPPLSPRADKLAEYKGREHSARPYVRLRRLVKPPTKGRLLPVVGITFGPNVSDQLYHDAFVGSAADRFAKRTRLEISRSRLPYRRLAP